MCYISILMKIPEQIIEDGQTDILFNVPSLRHDVDPKMQAFLDMIAQREVEATDPLGRKIKGENSSCKSGIGNGGRNTCDVQYI